ncbi:MAG: tetratricopeptide repeat protein [Egibacteraceae bacterium]
MITLTVGVALGRFVLVGSGRVEAPPALEQALAAQIAKLEQAVAAQPDNVSALASLGVGYTRRAAQVGDPTFYSLAGQAFDKADKLEPDDPATLLGRGNLELSLHQFPKALKDGQRALEALPGNASALGVIVDAQVELGQYEDAADSLQQMLDLRPSLAALSRASYLRQLHGDLPGALIAMRQAQAAGSGSPFDLGTVTALIGDLHFVDGGLDAAEAAYDRADRTASGIVAAAVGRAKVLAAKGERSTAIRTLSAAVDRHPHLAGIVLLGELQALDGRDQDASDAFDLVRAIATLQRSSGQVLDLEMALFEADHGDPARAVDLARAAYAARPDNVFAADALAWSLLQDGRADEAVRYTDQAMRLSTADPLLRYHSAEVLAAAGHTDRARAELQAAFDLTAWVSFHRAADAAALARQLGVPVPEPLRRR